MTSPNESSLRQQIIKCLSKDQIDYGKLLELSNQIAQLDPENVRFSVDASHIRRIGRELVVKKETAVSELVKNAFDADATHASLTFENTDRPGGRLIIEDDGNGMTKEQLINGFMRLSTTDKIHEPYSPTFHRLRAGRKGIGRFAAHRLGSKLTVISQTKNSRTAHQIKIDWGLFGADQELSQITSQIETVDNNQKPGTLLVIDDLEDGWTVEAITRVYRYLIDLLQPFPISKLHKADNEDPGFEVNIYRLVGEQKEEVASVEKLIYEYALAEIDGVVDKKGMAFWSIKSKYLNIDERHIPILMDDKKLIFTTLKNVKLKAYA